MKRAREGDYESSMDKEDDCMTVAQLIRSRKKFSDVEKTGGDASESLGKRSRRYMLVDSDDDSGPCQKHASMEVEQRSVEDGGTAKKTEITRQTCDAVNGSNAENKTMIDDATKEEESWLHEDKEMKKRCIGKFSSEVKKEEDVDERLRQRKLAIEEIALELEARLSKVLPLSQVVQKLEEGFPAKCRRSRMPRLPKIYKISESVHMTGAREDDNESSMDEEDDYMTVLQLIRSRKKFSDVEKTGGDASESLRKRTRRYMVVDSDDDSGPCQKHAWMEVEQRSVEDDGTSKKTKITRQTCDDINGSNAERKAMIDDAIKEAESWLHEDREMKKKCIDKFCSKAKKEEDVDKRLRQTKLAIEKIALELETRIIKMETSLAESRKWKSRGNQTKNGFLLS
ncbi:unnamed protein product [Arabidopsis arenosa]|uniref:Uncharacterized protein n=1 Tax=Arabidopsis arenosa TaxID=38785 RepID=A0A8S2AIL2_ARAAE|nr:unnamed protein product [Arabidopsis arenosa]